MLSLASRWLRGPGRKLTVAREGRWVIGITIGVGLAAINTGNNLLFLVWGMLLSAVMLSGVLSEAALRALTIRGFVSLMGMSGHLSQVQIEMRNDNDFLEFCRQVGTLWRHDEGDEFLSWGPFWVEVSPKSERTAHFSIEFPKRGRWHLCEVQSRTSYPFAFFEKTRFRKVSGFYSWIGPRCREVEIELDILRDRGALVQDERAGLWGDIRGIRPYRQGDSLGLIHWLSTATPSNWMSKELEEARGLSVSLRWAPLQHEDLEVQLSDLHSVVSRLLKHRVDVHLELDVLGALELRGDRGLQQLNFSTGPIRVCRRRESSVDHSKCSLFWFGQTSISSQTTLSSL